MQMVNGSKNKLHAIYPENSMKMGLKWPQFQITGRK